MFDIVTGRLGVVLISLLFYVLLRNCNKKIRSKCKIVVLLSQMEFLFIRKRSISGTFSVL